MGYRKILTLLIALMFTSCSKYIISPAQIKLPEYGSFQMIQGTRDGCDTAHSSRGNSMYRMLFGFEQKPELILDDEYFDSWYRGYIYCFHIINRNAFGSIDDYMQPEHGIWFWQHKDDNKNNPEIGWALQQGVDIELGGKIQFFGEGENWWNTKFLGNQCKGIFQCSN